MLTSRKKLFIAEYLVDENATQAAIRAGYSAKSAYSQACRLLKDVQIAGAIEEAREQRFKRTLISADYVLSSIKDTVERCKQAEPVLDAKGNETGEYQFQPFAVLKGSELLGKHLKLFTDRLEVTSPDARKDLEQRIEFGLEGYRRLAKAILAQCCETCREQVPPELTKRDILELMSKTPEMLGELYPIVQQELASEAVQ